MQNIALFSIIIITILIIISSILFNKAQEEKEPRFCRLNILELKPSFTIY